MSQKDADKTKTEDEVNAFGDPQTYAVLGAAMEVHRVLGPGFLEPVYQDALAIELTDRAIPFYREEPLSVLYKGQKLGSSYRADFRCYDSLLVELKALSTLTKTEFAIAINYLKATSFERCLLINFGAARLEFKRFVLSSHLRQSATSAVTPRLPRPESE